MGNPNAKYFGDMVEHGFSTHAFRLSQATFSSAKIRKKTHSKFLHLISEAVLVDDHLPKQVSMKGFRGATIFV